MSDKINLNWVSDDLAHSHSKILLRCGIIAFLLEAVFLTAIGWHEHWLSHPQRTTPDETRFVEAQMYQVPPESHLVDEKKPTAAVHKQEQVLSKVVGKGAVQKTPSTPEEENQTQAGPKMAASHGPVAIYAPPPVIPSYLQDKELKTSVVIDFYVNAQGHAAPRLVGSSGNEELDAIALKSVSKWQFRPAEKDNLPIESKVRLRIVFEVK